MSGTDFSFFDYTCDRCGAPVCERVQIMNLALDFVDTLECLSCLAERQGMSMADLAGSVRDYIDSRECFSTPWRNFRAGTCPLIEIRACYCQDEPGAAAR